MEKKRSSKKLLKEKKIQYAKKIQKKIANIHNIRYSELISYEDSKRLNLIRQISIFTIRNITILNLKEIGKIFSNRKHSTIVYSLKRIEKKCKEDVKFKEKIKKIEQIITKNYENRYYKK
ncbi:helix-turn-helix domain-containing protein [bacterium endosymbiont of Pedicinus badii]|uniref:helix-turn-helix domain-containing protein n=1 Tax=bacterium endosymbiont of Pedicinus badii TaxID=1719126 RepID=UPI0009D608DF|nr:helix-turn-helix domain-containing protein [bacterium endosymbiont of Pedicinus badii]OQM34073.1 hypothetical protein AOQ89_01815 [bacterium endosymbiont of Pedicinus badii]